MLYGKDEEIHAVLVDNELEEESETLLDDGWSHTDKNEVKIESIQIDSVSDNEHDDIMYTAIEAERMNSESIDMRPCVKDKRSGQWILLDSGAAVTAIPPEPGDIPDPKVRLKAVNGTRLKSYGTKLLEIQVNRKTYPILAIKTDVKYPILG